MPAPNWAATTPLDAYGNLPAQTDIFQQGARIGGAIGGLHDSIQKALLANRVDGKVPALVAKYNDPNDPDFKGLTDSQRALKLSKLLLPWDPAMAARYETRAAEIDRAEKSQKAETDKYNSRRKQEQDDADVLHKRDREETAKDLKEKRDYEDRKRALETTRGTTEFASELMKNYRANLATLANPLITGAFHDQLIADNENIKKELQESTYGRALTGTPEPPAAPKPLDLGTPAQVKQYEALKGQITGPGEHPVPELINLVFIRGLITREAMEDLVKLLAGKKETVAATTPPGDDASKVVRGPEDLKRFQLAQGLKGDGKMGPRTQASLDKMGMTYDPKPAPAAQTPPAAPIKDNADTLSASIAALKSPVSRADGLAIQSRIIDATTTIGPAKAKMLEDELKATMKRLEAKKEETTTDIVAAKKSLEALAINNIKMGNALKEKTEAIRSALANFSVSPGQSYYITLKKQLGDAIGRTDFAGLANFGIFSGLISKALELANANPISDAKAQEEVGGFVKQLNDAIQAHNGRLDNTVAKSLVKSTNAVSQFMNDYGINAVVLPKEPGKADQGPKEGDKKEVYKIKMVFQNGKWVKQ